MSHVDEGALHAYLDGALDEYPATEAARIRAHLDECPVCAGRLEEERAVRTEAHGILGLAAPEVELPSFEELRAYVERTRPTGGAISMRSYRMRMAASVVLALGVGWMLRGGTMPMMVEAPRDAALESASAPSEAGQEVPATTAVSSEPEMLARAAGAAFADEALEPSMDASLELSIDASAADGAAGFAVGAAESSPVVAQAARTVETGGAGSGASIGPERQAEPEIRSAPAPEIRAVPEVELRAADADVVAEKLAEEVAAEDALKRLDAEDAGVVADADAAPIAESDAAGAVDDLVRAEEAPTDVVAGVDAPAAPAAGAADSTGPDEARPEAAERERATRSARLPVTSAMERNAVPTRRPARDDREPVPDIPSLTVAGYEVVTVTNLGEGTAPVGTHVVQRFVDGATFEIFHLEPDVSRDVVPMPAAGVGEVEVLTEGGWIVLQGPRAAEELEELLAALFPAG